MKKYLFLILCLLIVVSLSACKKVYVQDGDSKLVIKTSELTETDKVEELISRAKNIKNIYYDFNVQTENGQVSKGKYWQNKEKIRIEKEKNGKKTISISDQENNIFYLYNPENNTADKMILSLGARADATAMDLAAGLEKYNLEIVGKEVVDNINCLLVQYKDGAYLTRVWLWQKYGLPVKVEAETTDGKSITTYEKFNFNRIEDIMFKIPETAEINDLTSPLLE
ncbi:MAG: hypothetical protein NTZ49_04385 [Candidatus Parcubacteria bacterium]|nr:hypothetical protein [Candidatus Parcubacteria bacterium]